MVILRLKSMKSKQINLFESTMSILSNYNTVFLLFL